MGLSFSGCLALVGTLHDLVASGSQVLLATHSPVVAALPGATILHLGEGGNGDKGARGPARPSPGTVNRR